MRISSGLISRAISITSWSLSECSGEPSRLLAARIENGKLGMKSGQGLRVWTSEQKSTVCAAASHVIC